MKKDDVFLNLFFNKKEVSKIKKVDKLHSRKLMDISKLNGYIMKYRILTYIIFTLLTAIFLMLAYIMCKYKIFFNGDEFDNIPLLIARGLPTYFLILIIIELFLVFNKIYEVDGTIFNKQVKRSFILSFIYLIIIIMNIIYTILTYMKYEYVKADLLILLFAIFYIGKSILDIKSFGVMYLKSKSVK